MNEMPLSLWHPKPATKWVEALPLGNGRIGAMVFGGTNTERIALNEDTLWSSDNLDGGSTEADRYSIFCFKTR